MNGIIRVADLAREGGDDRALRRSAERGIMVRLARGRFLEAGEWNVLDPDEKYRAQVRAFAETTRTVQVFSHWSAAALWGIPIVGVWPSAIHVAVNPKSGQRSTRRVVRHLAALRDDEVVQRDGLFVTSPLRTVVDLARTARFETGVAVVDFAITRHRKDRDPALHVEHGLVIEAADQLANQRGVRRLRRVGEFADGRSGSAGESFSRVQIARAGLPAPDLQVEVIDREGRTWHTDFGWKDSALLGEFDGRAKYTRNRYLQGREVAEVVIEEKLREDAIRLATGFGMVRWTWPVASDVHRLERLLVSAGLRRER